MSIPAFGWALVRGADLKLRPSDRLVLLFLADQANHDGLCRSGQERIEKFTGLDRKTIQAATGRLAAAQLIRVTATLGMVTKYEILRSNTPGNGTGVHPGKAHQGTPGKRSVVTPGNGTGVDPGKTPHQPRETAPVTPGNGTPVPCTSQESFPKRRASAPEAGKILRFGKQQEGAAPQPAPPALPTPPNTPAPAATPGSDDFNSFLEAPTPAKALPAEIEQEVVRADVPEPDAPLGPRATGAFVHSLARNFQNNYPARAPRLSRAEQVDLCQPKPSIRPAYLPEAVLRLARMQLAERAAPP